jgi:hypothetical protein
MHLHAISRLLGRLLVVVITTVAMGGAISSSAASARSLNAAEMNRAAASLEANQAEWLPSSYHVIPAGWTIFSPTFAHIYFWAGPSGHTHKCAYAYHVYLRSKGHNPLLNMYQFYRRPSSCPVGLGFYAYVDAT